MDTPVFCIVGASGTGKTTTVNNIVDNYGRIDVIVSHTTRDRREGEVDGRDYHFVSDFEFDQQTKLEKVEYDGNRYCLSYEEMTKKLNSSDNCVLLVITDIYGLRQLEMLFNNSGPFSKHRLYSVYFKASIFELLKRLIKRDGIKGIKRVWHALKAGELRGKEEQKLFDLVFDTGEIEEEEAPDILVSKIIMKLEEDMDGQIG